MKKHIIITIILILQFMFFFVFFNKCENDRNALILNDFHKNEMKFEKKKDSLNQIIVLQKLLIEENNQVLQQVLKENAQLREDVAYQSKVNFSLKIENEKLKKTVEKDGKTDYELTNDCVSLILEHLKDEDEMNLKKLEVMTDLTLSIGKKGTVSAVFSNSCINVNSMNTLKVQEKQKWWQNGWLRFGAGFLVGGSLIFLK